MHYTSKETYEFISRQTWDKIIERKICEISWTEFPIFQSDLDFYDKISPVFDWKKYQIPTPKLCPEERQRRRLMFRNERKLYRKKCDATGENIISMYSPDKEYKIYNQKYRWSDKWDAMIYWFNFNFNKSFNKQLNKLILNVPRFSMLNIESENSEYTNHVYKAKDSYMCFSSVEPIACINTRWAIQSNKCNDCSFIEQSEECYQTIKCKNCFNLQFSTNCEWCSNSKYLYDCQNCSFCFNCSNIKNKTYYINNIKHTKDEYNDLISKAQVHKIKDIKTNIQINSEWSYGNNITNCKNCMFVSDLSDSENVKYTFDDAFQKNTYDCYWWSRCENVIESMSCWNWYKSWFICYWNEAKFSYFCNKCYNINNCFACVWLRNKQYCIFNKQYTKEEYNKLVPQIIEKMIEEWSRWEFFDPSLSPFGYNETVAQEYFPLTREEALARWYKRQDNNYDPVVPDGIKTLKWDEIPSDINQVTDDILKQILICEVSWRPFRIIKQELEFYRKHNLSLPRKHPDVRHQERLRQRPPRELHLRSCDQCDKQMISVYDKKFRWKILCEECYQKEIY